MTAGNAGLDDCLKRLTTWSSDSPALWRRALDSEAEPRNVAPKALVPNQTLWRLAQVCLVFVVFAIVVSISFPSLSRARELSQAALQASEERARQFYRLSELKDKAPATAEMQAVGYLASSGETEDYSVDAGGESHSVDTPLSSSTQPPTAARQIIQKGDLDIAVRDVTAAFHKIRLIVNDALGEYIEESTLSGSGANAAANLTLRVAASRVSDVMNQIRQLGEVRSENLVGQDVTAAVVDLDARLSNERRVEKELLDLLERRKDAPLKEILELRRGISEVRGSIEQMVAQREKFSRLVSLATLLVIVRPADAPTPEQSGAFPHFAIIMGKAWRDGLDGLMDSLAFLVMVMVGGMVIWVLAGIIIIVVWRVSARRVEDSATK